MKIRQSKVFGFCTNLWRQVCMVFFAFTGLLCFQTAFMLLQAKENFFLGTALIFPPLSLIILTLFFSSGTFYIIAYERKRDDIKEQKKVIKRLEKDNQKKLEMITKLRRNTGE